MFFIYEIQLQFFFFTHTTFWIDQEYLRYLYTYIYTHAYTHTYIHIYIQTPIHTCIYNTLCFPANVAVKYINSQTYKLTYTHIHLYILHAPLKQIVTYTCMQTNMYSVIHESQNITNNHAQRPTCWIECLEYSYNFV